MESGKNSVPARIGLMDLNKLRVKIENFQKSLNSNPKESEVKINKMAKGSKFLPIGVCERTLDEIYSGLWQTRNFEYLVVVNELVGHLELWVFHPLLGEWICRVGSAAVPITVKAGQDFTVIQNKITNACVTVAPHLKAECIKNAAKSLGVKFGRNLNRVEDYSTYQSLSEMLVPEEVMDEAELLIEVCTTREQVREIYGKYASSLKKDFAFRLMFTNKMKTLPADEKSPTA